MNGCHLGLYSALTAFDQEGFFCTIPAITRGLCFYINPLQGCFMLSLVEVGRVVLEMNVVNVFFINFYYLPSVEDKAKFESFYPGVVCDKFG